MVWRRLVFGKQAADAHAESQAQRGRLLDNAPAVPTDPAALVERLVFGRKYQENKAIEAGIAERTRSAGKVSDLALHGGQLLPTPTFLLHTRELFDRTHRGGRRSNGRFNDMILRAQPGRDPAAVGRMYRAFWWSAHWLRESRGYPALEGTGAPHELEVLPEGIVIERRTEGRRTHTIVAYDVEGLISPDEYGEALKRGIAYRDSEWQGELNGGAADADYVPLFQLTLRELVSEPEQAADPFAPPSNLHGSARFAWIDEMVGAGLDTFSHRSVPLGLFEFAGENHGFVNWNGEGHTLTVGPPGSGKFTAGIAPLLLTADTASAVVFDVKNGEAARVTGAHRASLGDVTVLDPFGVSGMESGGFNPLDLLRADDPYLLEKARRLAAALYIPGSRGDDYFDNQARSLLTATLLHVATWPLEEDRTLKRVRQIIRRRFRGVAPGAEPGDEEGLDQDAMRANTEVADGWVADKASFFSSAAENDAGRQAFAVVDTLESNTEFLDLPAVQRVTARTTIDVRALRSHVSTLYVVCPANEVRNVNRWLRMIYTVLMEELRVGAHDAGAGVPLHVVMDEFPQLGRFERVADDMAVMRDLDVHLHIVTQSLEQLRKLYGDDLGGFFALAEAKRLLGCNDMFTAERFSAAMGKTTRRAQSESHSRSAGGGGSQGESVSLVSRDLMSADELLRMQIGRTYVVAKGLNTLRLDKAHYLLIPALSERATMTPLDDAAYNALYPKLYGRHIDELGGGDILEGS